MSSARSAALSGAVRDAVWGMVIADAVSMPVHWFYEVEEIKKRYDGWITDYLAPCEFHPSSFMGVSKIDDPSKPKSVVGSVILHDKLPIWTSGSRTTHYHVGMRAGDSTLTSLCCLVMMESLRDSDPNGDCEDQRLLRGKALESLVTFLTTPGSHNDSFAESFIRGFFQDWILEGKPTSAKELLFFAETRSQRKMSGEADYPLTGISCLMMAIPWVLHNAHRDEAYCVASALDWCHLTHPLAQNDESVAVFSRLLYKTLHGESLQRLAMEALTLLGKADYAEGVLKNVRGTDARSEATIKIFQKGVDDLGLPCAVPGSLTSMLLIAAGFPEDFSSAVLMNANCGGENCHRAGGLGACLGAAAAYQENNAIATSWKDGVNSARKYLDRLF